MKSRRHTKRMMGKLKEALLTKMRSVIRSALVVLPDDELTAVTSSTDETMLHKNQSRDLYELGGTIGTGGGGNHQMLDGTDLDPATKDQHNDILPQQPPKLRSRPGTHESITSLTCMSTPLLAFFGIVIATIVSRDVRVLRWAFCVLVGQVVSVAVSWTLYLGKSSELKNLKDHLLDSLHLPYTQLRKSVEGGFRRRTFERASLFTLNATMRAGSWLPVVHNWFAVKNILRSHMHDINQKTMREQRAHFDLQPDQKTKQSEES